MQRPDPLVTESFLSDVPVEFRFVESLRAVLLMLGGVIPVLIGLSFRAAEPLSEPVGLFALWLLVLCMYTLLQLGKPRLVARMLVVSLVAYGIYGIATFGSVRSSAAVAFPGAIAAAGIVLSLRSLVATLVVSVASLAALTWAEAAGLLPTPDLRVGTKVWLMHSAVFVGLALGVYTSQRILLKALAGQQRELARREQAEAALRISEDRLSRIFRNSPVAILVQAADSKIVMDVNPAFERMSGYSREEFVGSQECRALWADAAAHQACVQQLKEAGRLFNLEAVGRRKDGSHLNVLISCELEGEGSARIMVSTLTDISAEVSARQAARQSAELFTKAFNLSPIYMAVSRASDGVFLVVNAAADTANGYTAQELLGRTSLEMGAWRSTQDRDRFMANLRAQEGALCLEIQMRHKDGHLVDCQQWAVIVEIAGEECVLSAVLNITQQKRREVQLLDLAQGLSGEVGAPFFQSLVRSLGKATGAHMVMVGEINADRTITSLAVVLDNQTVPNLTYELAGTPCDVALVSTDVCAYADHVHLLFPKDKVLAEGCFKAYLGAALNDADGTPIGILNALWRSPQTVSPDRDALIRIFASRTNAELIRLRRDREILRLTDSLEQRVNDRTYQLKATNAELESFGYSVSHDLQAPLRSIQGFIVLLSRRLAGRLSVEENRLFDRIQVNVMRMHELIRDLLALARASQGELVLELVDLSAMAGQVIAQHKLGDPSRQVSIIIEPHLKALCDAKFARIVLENLIGNAWKYSLKKTDAHITVGVMPAPEKGRQMLFVRDDGAGFSMEYAGNLFKPFFRLHNDDEFEGSGIGLATVHRILERHGGTIRAEAAEGLGASFYFSFDRHAAKVAHQAA
ncbi:PAS domain S-box protein [Polaromonas sp.]|uniref:PAS domain-containing sensor histidine kinase n=1 Tax=Polaromonas sp. TaxID=1869339 RepID=UPI00183056C7|nr:PAS domain S-box protein [Polaromonas sp.]NMM06522.1 PAS domain S-box protein [Polaromonas sp.]